MPPLTETFSVTTARGRETHRIFLKNHEISVSMGIHGFERAARQRLLVNVDLYVAVDAAHAVDEIGAVLDYDFLREAIARMAASRHYDLQETFCREVVDICLSKPEVLGVRVATEKPDVYPDCEGVGYEIVVSR